MLRGPVGTDGWRVRASGNYARQKLAFLKEYLPAALTATKRKQVRVYVDLFAGPGRNEDRYGEFEAGAMSALTSASVGTDSVSFTDAALVNIRPSDHLALCNRVRAANEAGRLRVPFERISLIQNDANAVISSIVERYDQWAYLLVFADIEAPSQLPFASLQALCKRQKSIDLYVLFPLDMAVSRLLAYDPAHRHRWAPILNAFFGSAGWQNIAERHRANPDRRFALNREITAFYCKQLRTLWANAEPVLDVRLRGSQRLYKMVFATNHDAAVNIRSHLQRAAARAALEGQLGLL